MPKVYAVDPQDAILNYEYEMFFLDFRNQDVYFKQDQDYKIPEAKMEKLPNNFVDSNYRHDFVPGK